MKYTNRYIGEYPIIGIRPIIDARQGMLDVRGSLEEQTMNMARAVKELEWSAGSDRAGGRYHRTCCRSSGLRT